MLRPSAGNASGDSASRRRRSGRSRDHLRVLRILGARAGEFIELCGDPHNIPCDAGDVDDYVAALGWSGSVRRLTTGGYWVRSSGSSQPAQSRSHWTSSGSSSAISSRPADRDPRRGRSRVRVRGRVRPQPRSCGSTRPRRSACARPRALKLGHLPPPRGTAHMRQQPRLALPRSLPLLVTDRSACHTETIAPSSPDLMYSKPNAVAVASAPLLPRPQYVRTWRAKPKPF